MYTARLRAQRVVNTSSWGSLRMGLVTKKALSRQNQELLCSYPSVLHPACFAESAFGARPR